MRRGNIRVKPEAPGFEFIGIPTRAQWEVIKQWKEVFYERTFYIEQTLKDYSTKRFCDFEEFEEWLNEKANYYLY